MNHKKCTTCSPVQCTTFISHKNPLVLLKKDIAVLCVVCSGIVQLWIWERCCSRELWIQLCCLLEELHIETPLWTHNLITNNANNTQKMASRRQYRWSEWRQCSQCAIKPNIIIRALYFQSNQIQFASCKLYLEVRNLIFFRISK